MDITLIIGINLITLTIAVIGLLLGLVYFLFRETRRVSDLEVNYRALNAEVAKAIRGLSLSPGSNDDPLNEASRRDILLRKWQANIISRDEAIELNEILLKEKKRAEERGDTASLVAIVLGLILLGAFLSRRC